MADLKELIAALRCSASANAECRKDCPYFVLERIKPSYPVPADEVIDGVGYWNGCDVDRIALDAADALEEKYGRYI